MLIGCGDCITTAVCQVKVLTAVILPASSPDDTGSYCPHTYNCSYGGASPCLTTCGAATNMVAWLNAQFADFQNDALYPWNYYTTAYFADSTAATPTCPSGVSGCTDGITTSLSGSFGGTSYGSLYSFDAPGTAQYGAGAGNLCAWAQIVAFKMTGELFIAPLNVAGITEPCLENSGAPCSPSGVQGTGVYYIPLPPCDTDICGAICSPSPCAGFEVAYIPYQLGNNDDCLPSFAGGSYTNCQSPDPFFGDDPP